MSLFELSHEGEQFGLIVVGAPPVIFHREAEAAGHPEETLEPFKQQSEIERHLVAVECGPMALKAANPQDQPFLRAG